MASSTIIPLIVLFPFLQPQILLAQAYNSCPNGLQPDSNGKCPQQQEPFFTYDNSTYGITIKYPSTWVKEESHNQTAPGHIVKFRSPAGTAPASLNIIGGNPAPQSIPLQEYVGASINVLRQSFNNFNLITSNSTTLSGFPARELVYTATQTPRLELKFMQILTIKDSEDFVITFAALTNDFSTYLPTIHTMIDSFGFVPSAPQSNGPNYTGVCHTVQPVLIQSCDALVNPDGSLTQDGTHAFGCIKNGILLGGAAALIGVPLPVVLKGLSILAAPSGCVGDSQYGRIHTA